MDSLNRTFYGIETQGMAIGIEDSWGVLIGKRPIVAYQL